MSKIIYCYNNHLSFDKNRICDSLATIFIQDEARQGVYAICVKCIDILPLRSYEQEISKEEYMKYKKAELLL